MKKRIVLIDAHALIHRAYHALPGFVSSKGVPTGALYGLSMMVMRAIDELHPYALFACFDLPKPTFRHVAYDAYKGTREKSDDALIAQLIRAKDVFDAFGIPRFEKEGFEADDLIGTLATELKKNKDFEIIIVSGDMDTMQLIDGEKVRVYTLKKGIQDTQMYDEKKVLERYGFGPQHIVDYKGLAGDPSDNIPGIKGIGEKSATDLITQFGSIESMYKVLKKDRTKILEAGIKERIVGLLEQGEEEALFSKALATIKCDVPISVPPVDVSWFESFTPHALVQLFEELEFRSLKSKVAFLGQEKPQNNTDKKEKVHVTKKEKASVTYPHTILFREAQAMIFLLDSDKTDQSLEEICTYASAQSIEDAHVFLSSEIAHEPMLSSVYENIDKPLIPVVMKMEEVGIKINKQHFAKVAKEYHELLTNLERKIWQFAGKEFLITSPQQLGVVLYDELGLGSKIKKTAKGARSTNAEMLESIQNEHPIIPLVLEHREIQKLLSTYLDPLPLLADEHDVLHTRFLHTGAATGRFASKDPNLQNIPIKNEHGKIIREGFVPREGFSFLSCDYSQIELRVAAILSGDEHLQATFRDGKDPHASVAAKVFSVPEHEVTSDQRRIAKVLNFGVLYGMGVNALKATLGSDRKEAQLFYDSYRASFPVLMAYLEDVKMQARKNGFTETLFGRRRHLNMMKSPLPFIRAQGERMAINAPIQGTNADILRIALLDIHSLIQQKKWQNDLIPVLQIHDELIFEVKKGMEVEVEKVVVETMETVLERHKKESSIIPIAVSSSFGTTWGAL